MRENERVYETATDTLVTSIEILSPANKRGEGLREYQRKRSRLLRVEIHLGRKPASCKMCIGTRVPPAPVSTNAVRFDNV
ncbi:MAG: DUF4058 family protein, partial [Caldilineaceae bacterium]|nr:DUF4058 family protein [Caldilineaceae bacterium]